MSFRLAPALHFNAKVIAICIIWYIVSSAGSITNKIILETYPYPMTLALSNLMWVPLYSIPLLRLWEVKAIRLTPIQYRKFLVPISLGKALAVGSAYFSLWKVPVSYAHTVKASMPLFAVILSRVLLKEKQTYRVYVSLLPIVAGVIIASATELSFSLSGLLSALFSTLTYSFLNILVKKLLKESEIHPIRLLAMNSQMAAVIFFPFWLFKDAISMAGNYFDDEHELPLPDLWMLCLLAVSGFLSFVQNVCAFSLIHQLTALSYSVCNATKRITVIGTSLITLHNPVTGANVFGMMLSVVGVFCYNRAKQIDRTSAAHSLPFSRSHSPPSDSTAHLMEQFDKDQNDDLLYRASSRSYVANGSRLGELDYSDTHTNKQDDISSRRTVRFA